LPCRTGKDELFSDLKMNKLKLGDSNIKWIVYTLDNPFILKLLSNSNLKRYAFADGVKNKTHDFLRLQNCSSNTFKNVKDQIIVNSKSMRDWYKFIADEEKVKDSDYWTKIVHHQIEKEIKTCVICNLRFQNEILEMDKTIILLLP
jgi:hypothetical protein